MSGECHYFFGKAYRLELVEQVGKPEVQLLKSGKLKLFVRHGSTVEQKDKLLQEWYREQLNVLIAELLKKWQPIVGKQVSDWGIRKMKTKWGSCNTEQGRIWLNLDLAKKPRECVEYILVHELTHLHERHHNERFKRLLESYLPNWRARQSLLNQSPLSHENWLY